MTKENVVHNIAVRGFTLIELLVVILIIGILAAIALPQYQKAVLKSRITKGIVHIQVLDEAQRVYYLANGSFATVLDNLDLKGDWPGSCGFLTPIVFCQLYVRTRPEWALEWQGDISTGKTRWICLTTDMDETANQICSAYAKDWGGSGNKVENTTSHINYYYGIYH